MHAQQSCGAIPAGGIPAILLNIPGTPASIAATWDGSTIRVYHNGVLDGERAFPHSLATDDSELWIGRYYSAFSGDIDEVRIYDRALSAAELEQQLASRNKLLFGDSSEKRARPKKKSKGKKKKQRRFWFRAGQRLF